MKMVKAIIKPERFELVKKALEEKGVTAMTLLIPITALVIPISDTMMAVLSFIYASWMKNVSL